MKRWANLLLGVWLVATALIALADLAFRGSSTVLAIVAIVAGVLLILAEGGVKLTARAADIVLGAWLILMGLIPLLDIRFRGSHTVLEVLALAAGVLILIMRR